jgi:UDP-2,3-diacylglucosamine hydrolase
MSCGLLALSDPTVLIGFGQRVMLTHGDALCLSDVSYQRFRSQVRSPAWRTNFLSRPIDERRKAAREIREESERRRREEASGQRFDVDFATMVRWMHEAGTSVVIHGHTHMPGSDQLAPGFDRHVLSDWDADHSPQAPRAQVLRWRREGIERLAPEQACD